MGAVRDVFVGSARGRADTTAADEIADMWLPLALPPLLGRDGEVETLRQEARARLGTERWAAAYAAGRRSLSLPTSGTSPFRSAWSRRIEALAENQA